MKTVLVGLTAFVIAVTMALPAMAQSREVRLARRHMEAGQEFFLQERWQNAAEEFMAAYELRAHTAFLYNAALAYHRQGNAREALELYRRYITDNPTARDRARVEESIRLLERAASAQSAEPCTDADCPGATEQEECAEDDVECQLSRDASSERNVQITLDPAAAAAARTAEMKSVILVEVEPANATVKLFDAGGREIAQSTGPMEYTADAGRYTLVMEHSEYRTVRTPVQVNTGRYYVFHIEMSQPPAFLQVTANVPGATVSLDDREVGSVGVTPWGNVVSSGTHRVWVERPGYQPIVQDLEIGLGQERTLEIQLERLAFGQARVLTNVEEATVFIDGEEVGGTPVTRQLAPGEHQLRVTARRMKEFETSFQVNEGQTTRILVRMNPRPSRTSAWVSLAFSALTFIASGVIGWYSTTIYDDLEQLAQQGRLATDDDRIDRGFAFAIGADVGFGVGAIIAGLTLYYFLRDPLPDSEGRVQEPTDFTENPELPNFRDPGPLHRQAGAAVASEPPPSAQPAAPAAPTDSELGPTPEAPAPAPEAPTPTPAVDENTDISPEAMRWLQRRSHDRTASRSPRMRLGFGPGFLLHF